MSALDTIREDDARYIEVRALSQDRRELLSRLDKAIEAMSLITAMTAAPVNEMEQREAVHSVYRVAMDTLKELMK